MSAPTPKFKEVDGAPKLDGPGLALSARKGEADAPGDELVVTGAYRLPTNGRAKGFTLHGEVMLVLVDCFGWRGEAKPLTPPLPPELAPEASLADGTAAGCFSFVVPAHFGPLSPGSTYHLAASAGPHVSNVLVLRTK